MMDRIFPHVAALAIALAAVSCSVFGQTEKQTDTYKDVRIDPGKESVYLEFVKTGTCSNGNYYTSINVGPCEKSSEFDRVYPAVWLRLVNNTRWAIGVSVKKDSPGVQGHLRLSRDLVVTGAVDGAEFDVVYGVETETGCDFHKEAPKDQVCQRRETPVPKLPLPPISSYIFIPAGQSIVYAVERSNLLKYLKMFTLFTYQWEHTKSAFRSIYMPQHRVYFTWYGLEKGLKKESMRDKLKPKDNEARYP